MSTVFEDLVCFSFALPLYFAFSSKLCIIFLLTGNLYELEAILLRKYTYSLFTSSAPPLLCSPLSLSQSRLLYQNGYIALLRQQKNNN